MFSGLPRLLVLLLIMYLLFLFDVSEHAWICNLSIIASLKLFPPLVNDRTTTAMAYERDGNTCNAYIRTFTDQLPSENNVKCTYFYRHGTKKILLIFK